MIFSAIVITVLPQKNVNQTGRLFPSLRLQPYQLKDTPNRIEIEWDGDFELAGQFFKVITTNPVIGSLAIAGFPVDQMRELLAQVETFDQKFSDIYMQADALDLTPETIIELVRNGW